MSIQCINRYVVQDDGSHRYIIGRVEARDFTPSEHDVYLPLLDGGVLIPDDLRDAFLGNASLVLVPYRMCVPVEVRE